MQKNESRRNYFEQQVAREQTSLQVDDKIEQLEVVERQLLEQLSNTK